MNLLALICFVLVIFSLIDPLPAWMVRKSNLRIGALELKMVVSTIGSGKRVRSQGIKREQGVANPNLLRITGGTVSGMKIDSPNVYLRPMMAKVREALFNCLSHYSLFRTNATNVLDLYAGSGSVGLEALSRGAYHATFVDLAEDCISTALRNAKKCGFENRVRGVKGDVLNVIQAPEKYNIHGKYEMISLTPPYEEVVYNHLLDSLCASQLIAENSFVVLEYPVELGSLPFIWGQYELYGLRNRRYGRTILCVYVYKPTEDFDLRPDEFQLESVRRKKGS